MEYYRNSCDDCYLCSIESGDIELREHKSARWLTAESLDCVEWLPADMEVIEIINKSTR